MLPELFISGYNIGEQVWELAEPVDGESLQTIAKIAKQHHLAIATGYPERHGGVVYNSAALFDTTGELVGNYRKMHLYGPTERHLYEPGKHWVVAPIAGVQVGIAICYDVEFPEMIRKLASMGAELIAVPTALECQTAQTPVSAEIPNLVVPTRALESHVFIAYANHAGIEEGMVYCGSSCIVGPNGRTLARAEASSTLLIAEIELAAIPESQVAFSYWRDRRPELYREMAMTH